MPDDHDAREELRRQLELVTRRVDETIARLQDARASLLPGRAAHITAGAADQGRGVIFQVCVRLEVALKESADSVEDLARRLRQARESDPAAWPWAPEPDADAVAQTSERFQ